MSVIKMSPTVGQGSTDGLAQAATERKSLQKNGPGGLDLATAIAPPISLASRRRAPRRRFKVALAPWEGPPPIVSKPGDEVPLPTRAEVASVYDGDTFTTEEPKVHVRVQNVNAPEMKPLEAFAKEAGELTRSLVKGREVDLIWDPAQAKDGYGRLVSQVILADGSDLAEHLIERGLGHVFVIDEANNPADLDRLFAAQARAKKAGLGIWSLPAYQGAFSISSFHANGRGRDVSDPNVEYFRMVNITGETRSLKGCTVTNLAGRTFTLPDVDVRPGHTVKVYSGKGKNRIDATKTIQIYLGSDEPVWDNLVERLAIMDASGDLVVARDHATKQKPIDFETLKNPITQKRIRSLGADVGKAFMGPELIDVTGLLLIDDGDTYFVSDRPRPGAFKVKLTDDRTGTKVQRDLEIADTREAPPGMFAIRFLGIDTPETHLEVRQGRGGSSKHFSQGLSGTLATERLFEISQAATKIQLEPKKSRPFGPYGRMLAEVYATMPGGNVVWVNAQMVAEGRAEMSMSYDGPKDFDPEKFAIMSAASKAAKTKKLGIYGTGPGRCVERPTDFRRRLRKVGTPLPYVVDMANGIVYRGEDIDKVAVYDRLFIYKDNLLRQAIEQFHLKPARDVPAV